LTTCEAEDFEFVAGGPGDSDEFTFSLKPGDYRFTSGGRDGASLDNQLITITSTFHISQIGEILLGIIGILLMIGAVEMIYPIELFWKRYIKS